MLRLAALLLVVALGACGYHLGSYQPSPGLGCCHTTDHGG